MSMLSSLWKKKKPNLTPDIPQPGIGDLKFTKTLGDFAQRNIDNPQGFGEDFADRMSFAPTAQREARFREIERPQLESDLSSRGIQRSSIAGDLLSRQAGAKERDISSIVQQFTQLNMQQKKADERFGVGVAQGQQTLDANLQGNAAMASERLANKTAAQQIAFQNQDRELAMKGIGVAAAGLSGGMSGGLGLTPGVTGGAGGFLSGLGIGGLNAASPTTANIMQNINPGNVGSAPKDQFLALGKQQGWI